MRKKLLALLLAAALALSLLAGCGGGESVASALLKLLDGRYPNISIEIDPELEADLRQAIRKAEAENAGDDDAVIRAALEKLVGFTVTFRKLGEGQKGDTAFDLVFYAGSDPGKAAQAAYSQWNIVFDNVPDDGQYDTSLAMVETNSGVWMLVKATVEKAGTVDKPDKDDEPDPVTLKSLSVTGPSTTIYTAGQTFDPAGMTVTAHYSDGSTKTISGITTSDKKGVSWEPADGLAAGTNSVTIIYTDDKGQTISTKVPVTVNAITSVNAADYENLNDLKIALQTNPSITEVDFSNIKGSIPNDVLSGTNVSKVIVETGTTVMDGAFAGTKDPLTIEVTTGSGTTVNSSILGGASDVTLDLSDSGITDIGYRAFHNCDNLASVTFPEGLTGIASDAFNGCTKLESVDLSSCTSLTNNFGTGIFQDCDKLTSVTFPESLTIIPFSAFQDCNSLTSVTFPEGLTTIEESAFSGCTGLTSVTFPEGLNSIEMTAFAACTGLTSIDLNSCTGLTTIDRQAFYLCDSLSQVTLPNRGGTFSIISFAFAADSGPQPLHLRIPHPNMTLSLGDGSFFNREVTVYCDQTIETIKSKFNEHVTGPDGKLIDVKPLADW